MSVEKALVIVESPTKANTIKKFLGKNYRIEASFGHVRDLPQSSSDIPLALKKTEWAKLGVNVEENFEPLYIIPKDKTKRVRELKALAKDVDIIYLATDEDREGESISWHVIELLKPKVPVKRMVFHEITKDAIQKALKNTRELDVSLVRAQEARRILDRLYGYTLSPLLWKKIAYGLSAGRVQSTGVKMIVERERERIAFRKADYASITAQLFPATKTSKEQFPAKLQMVGPKRVATGKDFDELTGLIPKDKADKYIILAKDTIDTQLNKIKNETFTVSDVEERDVYSNPSIPFITSSLQQEANRKLGWTARDTMRVAQKLYEEGLITYMRTDSPTLSSEATNAARTAVEKLYGKQFLSKEVRYFSSKNKGAQEAHEAIRPAGVEFLHPDDIGMSGREKTLYELIWKRTMACQMERCHKKNMTVKIKAGDFELAAYGSRIEFAGFLRVYVEGSDDPEAALEDQEVTLPAMKVGEKLNLEKLIPAFHETKPPARYSEASLIQRLEKEGIGRPSTYASIIGTIIERGYVRKDGSSLIPTLTGFAVTQLLEDYFQDLIDYSFTSEMENMLDEIAEGKKESLAYLKQFYSGPKGLQKKVQAQEKSIKPEQSRTVRLPQLDKIVELKIGRYGPYVVTIDKKTKEEVHASIPEDVAPADITAENITEMIEHSKKGPTPIGVDPKSGKNVYCLLGRFGAYVQLGEVDPEAAKDVKPRRASITPPLTPATITLEQALNLLSLPRELGLHPESKKPVLANNGRFGPYVACDGEFRSLGKILNVHTVTLDEALEILAQPKVASRGATMLKDLGKDPASNKKVALYVGKYGPYLKSGVSNFSLPQEMRNEEILKKWELKDALPFMKKTKGK
ncbi:MAG: type I DNA topoisomerase [Bacteriovoracaceae bacterium]|nr:type I DNA topoisomerase [Bacteriovoracaceae bacterium]